MSKLSQVLLAGLLAMLAISLSQAALGETEQKITVLVANRGFTDAPYQHSVVVLPRNHSEEVGVIINLGGPFLPDQLLVLMREEESPGAGSMQLAHGLHLSIGSAVLERAVERSPGTARYYEVRLDTVFRPDTAGLWEELFLAAQGFRT